MTKKAKDYRLPETATMETLEMNWSCILQFGNKVLLAGHYFSKGRDYWYGAVYGFTTRDHTCEGEIRLTAVSDELFDDNGHAIEWAMKNKKSEPEKTTATAFSVVQPARAFFIGR